MQPAATTVDPGFSRAMRLIARRDLPSATAVTAHPATTQSEAASPSEARARPAAMSFRSTAAASARETLQPSATMRYVLTGLPPCATLPGCGAPVQ